MERAHSKNPLKTDADWLQGCDLSAYLKTLTRGSCC